MVYSPAFTLSNGSPLGFAPFAGLRLEIPCRFQVFLAASARLVGASSYAFDSVWRVHCAPSSVVGSNPAIKPIRLRRAGDFVR